MLNNDSSKKLLFVLIIGLLIFQSSSVGQIEKGPYLQNTTQTSITICWISAEIGFGEVKYGTDSGVGEKKSKETKTTHHQITLNNLKPQTEYYYRVAGNNYESEIYKFSTAPHESTAFSFVVLGDTRDGHEVHQKIIEKTTSHNPDFVIHTGDLVSKGSRQADWDKYFEINEILMRFTPYYPVLGNHEGNDERYYNYFALPDKENYYSFTWGNSKFIMLDSNKPFRDSASQHDFFKNELKEGRNNQFVFVTYHHPPYSASDKRKKEREETRSIFIDDFSVHKPDVVFNGHDHNYQRYYVDGINYVIAGGGGAPLYEIDIPDSGYVIGKKEFSYCVITVAGSQLKMEVYDLNGMVIDSHEIKK